MPERQSSSGQGDEQQAPQEGGAAGAARPSPRPVMPGRRDPAPDESGAARTVAVPAVGARQDETADTPDAAPTTRTEAASGDGPVSPASSPAANAVPGGEPGSAPENPDAATVTRTPAAPAPAGPAAPTGAAPTVATPNPVPAPTPAGPNSVGPNPAAGPNSAGPNPAAGPRPHPGPQPVAEPPRPSGPPAPGAPTQKVPGAPAPGAPANGGPAPAPPGQGPPVAGPRPDQPRPAPDAAAAPDAARTTSVPPTRPDEPRPDTGALFKSQTSNPAPAPAPETPGRGPVPGPAAGADPGRRPGPEASRGPQAPPRPVPNDQGRTAVVPSVPGGPTAPVPPGNRPGPRPETASAESFSEQNTQVLPRVTGSDVATEQLLAPSAPLPVGGDGPGGSDGGDADGRGRGPRRRSLLIVAAVVGVLLLVYLGDLLFSSGSVPRGVVVAGQEIGGLSRAAAIEKLQAAIEPRSSQPVPVTAGPVRSEIDPRAAGLSVDYQATLDQAGAQPLNPFTRVTSFFGTRDVAVVNQVDDRSVRTALEQLAPVVDRKPKDGNVRFEGATPVPVAPEPGQHLDVEAAVGTLEAQWATGAPVALPLQIEQPTTTPEDVQQAIDQVARPAVSGPLTVTGEGANATVTPEDIAGVLTFKADPEASPKLTPVINVEALTDVVKPQLAQTEKPGVDATLDFAVTPARVVPSVDGRGIDYKASFANLIPVLTGTGARSVPAVYANKPAEITTEQIQSLGSASEISTFTTGGFAPDSGVNIRRAAEGIDGKIVAPGETFSLNATTNPRDASRGYVDAGIIEDGRPARGVGGGVSQLATTLYNASYFAGMTDIEHKEHSFYISRYPIAREATVFDDIIDVKFRNDGPTPVLIRTQWTPKNVTVKFLGQKTYDVTSQTGPKTDFTQPQVINVPAGQPCTSSKGSQGFTATDTKTSRNLQTGEVTTKTRTVKYNPDPIVNCG